MMEPIFVNVRTGDQSLLSQTPTSVLLDCLAGRDTEYEPDEDADFIRRYAAIILRERGVL